jgi:hypothetical protein
MKHLNRITGGIIYDGLYQYLGGVIMKLDKEYRDSFIVAEERVITEEASEFRPSKFEL